MITDSSDATTTSVKGPSLAASDLSATSGWFQLQIRLETAILSGSSGLKSNFISNKFEGIQLHSLDG